MALASIMFGIGMGLTLRDFRHVLAGRRAFLLGMASMLVLVPATGIALALAFAPTPALAVGLILLATCPSGILSNVLTDMAKGDVALSISISMGLSVAYIFSLPFVLHLALGAGTVPQIALGSSVVKILGFTAVPVLAGMLLRAWAPVVAGRYAPVLKRATTGLLMILFALIVWREQETLQASIGTLLAIIIAMNAANLGIALLVGRLGRLHRKERIALVVEHLMRQEGTAIFVAVTLLGSTEMAVPMIVNTFIGMLGSAVVVGWVRFDWAGGRAAIMRRVHL